MRRPMRSPERARPLAFGLALVTLVVAPEARAEPQASVGLTIGAAGEGLERQIWKRRTAFHLGLHGDVMFGRRKTDDFGVGPYLEVFTHAFDEIQFGGGVSGLLPVIDAFPLVVSLGGYGRAAKGAPGFEPGIAGEIFWGSRSFNYHANYMLSGGLLTQMRYGLGPSHETSIVIAAQIDLGLFVLPILFLVTAARGHSAEAAPIK